MTRVAASFGNNQKFVDMKDPTGFVDPTAVSVSYNSTNRTITLTGTLDYYWRGVKKTLASPWTSTAHTDAVGSYFLYSSDGTNFTWSTDTWLFDYVMVSKVIYNTADKFALKETHGLMPWQVHLELHSQVGAYRDSGGILTPGTYAENTQTDAAITPGFDQAYIRDEDDNVSIPAWTQGTYTTMRIGASSVATFDTTATFPFRFTTAGYINYNNTTTGAEVQGATGKYYNVYQILVPATADTDSQKYRMLMLQPQRAHPSLADAQGEDVRNLNVGDLISSAPEFVIYARITYETSAAYGTTGKVVIPVGGITYLTGSKLAQVSVSGFTPSIHNDLSGLQGGTADEYYHLTATQYAALHAPVTVTDSSEIDFTLTGQDLTASIKSGSIDETKLDTSTNASLDLADTAVQPAEVREVLQADRTYYVRTDGNDANTGLVDSAAGAFLTIQAAINAASMLDMNSYKLLIQVRDGTYETTANTSLKNLVGLATSGDAIIQGNTSNDSAVIVSATSASCFTSQVTTPWSIRYMKLTTTTTGNCLYALSPGAVITFRNIDFGSCAGIHIRASTLSYVAKISGTNYTISGGATHHWFTSVGGSILDNGSTITLTGTPNFSTAFALTNTCGSMTVNSITFSGSATGKRYDAQLNGVINTAGGGASYLPGSVAGTTATGGQYV